MGCKNESQMKLKISFFLLFLLSNTLGFSIAPREIYSKERIAKTIAIADKNLVQKPITVTATQCLRSAGGHCGPAAHAKGQRRAGSC